MNWAELKNHEGYEINNLGEVRNSRTKKLLQQIKLGNGEVEVRMNGTRHRIHNLVAEAFIPNFDDKPFIKHKDGNRANNRIDNLEWSSEKPYKHPKKANKKCKEDIQRLKESSWELIENNLTLQDTVDKLQSNIQELQEVTTGMQLQIAELNRQLSDLNTIIRSLPNKKDITFKQVFKNIF